MKILNIVLINTLITGFFTSKLPSQKKLLPKIPTRYQFYVDYSDKICEQKNLRVYKKCSLEFDANDWQTLLHKGKNNNNLVILYQAGGPTPWHYGGKHFQLNNKIQKLSLSDIFVSSDIYSVKQPQHMKKRILYNNNLTIQETEQELNEYTDYLEKLIRYHQSKGKKVLLVGHSFGSYLVNFFLSRKGTVADYTASLNGRLNSAAGRLNNGKIYYFDNTNNINSKLFWPAGGFKGFTQMMRVTTDQEFDKLFSKLNFNNPVVWVNSVKDYNVGWFLEKEKNIGNKYGNVITIEADEIYKLQNRTAPKGAQGMGWTTHNSGLIKEIIIKWTEILKIKEKNYDR